MNFPNPHGHVFDQWGRDIVFDATGGQPYYGPSFSTKKYYPAMETNKAPRPGNVRTRPVGGAEILSSRHFPDEMQGNIDRAQHDRLQGAPQLQAERGRRRAEVDRGRADPRSRPTRTSGRSTPRSGPTARSTSLDWHNPIIGHMQHNLRDTSRDHDHGRVYRVTYPGRPLLKPAKIAGEPIDATARSAEGAGEPRSISREDRAQRPRHEGGA